MTELHFILCAIKRVFVFVLDICATRRRLVRTCACALSVRRTVIRSPEVFDALSKLPCEDLNVFVTSCAGWLRALLGEPRA